MSIISSKTARLCSTAAIVVAGFGAATSASASETWRFERQRGGGYAQSCDRFGGQRVCATVYCGRGVNGYEVGVTGWDPRGRGDSRNGGVAVDGRGQQTTYTLENDPIVGEVWRVDARRTGRLIDRIKAGRRLSMDIAARGPAYEFTLNGSNAAISQLERRCDRAANGNPRRDEGGVRVSDDSIRFGNGDIGFEIRFGEQERRDNRGHYRDFGRGWTKIDTLTSDRRGDRDVIEMNRRDGRFESLRLRALDNDVQIHQIKVRYGNGAEQNVAVDQRLREGQSMDVVELRGKRGRFIDRITLISDTRGRGPKAEIEVWGKKSQRQSQGPRFGRDWTRVASADVDRRRDRDVIEMNRRDGRFDELRLVALKNDVRVRKVMVRYGNGVEHEVDVDRRIREGQASDTIELRGRNGRAIDRITLVYDTQGRGPRAEVEIWGHKTAG